MKTTWRIANLKRNQETGVVLEISYLILFELEDQKAHYFETIAIENTSNESEFVPFESITEEIAISWVKSVIGEEKLSDIVTKTTAILEEKVAKRNDSIFAEGLPWQ